MGENSVPITSSLLHHKISNKQKLSLPALTFRQKLVHAISAASSVKTRKTTAGSQTKVMTGCTALKACCCITHHVPVFCALQCSGQQEWQHLQRITHTSESIDDGDYQFSSELFWTGSTKHSSFRNAESLNQYRCLQPAHQFAER